MGLGWAQGLGPGRSWNTPGSPSFLSPRAAGEDGAAPLPCTGNIHPRALPCRLPSSERLIPELIREEPRSISRTRRNYPEPLRGGADRWAEEPALPDTLHGFIPQIHSGLGSRVPAAGPRPPVHPAPPGKFQRLGRTRRRRERLRHHSQTPQLQSLCAMKIPAWKIPAAWMRGQQGNYIPSLPRELGIQGWIPTSQLLSQQEPKETEPRQPRQGCSFLIPPRCFLQREFWEAMAGLTQRSSRMGRGGIRQRNSGMKPRVDSRLSSHELGLVLEQPELEIPREWRDGWMEWAAAAPGGANPHPSRLLPTALERESNTPSQTRNCQ